LILKIFGFYARLHEDIKEEVPFKFYLWILD